MTQTLAAFTSEQNAMLAGQDLGRQVAKAFEDQSADACILFASGEYDHETLLRSFHETCRPKVLVGSSSAGEFTNTHRGETSACVLAIRSQDMRFAGGFSTGVSRDPEAAATTVASMFQGLKDNQYPYRAALVMTDALAGHTDELIEHLTVATFGSYEFAGGGAGDDAKFARTHVFCGRNAATDAIVALEILSTKPIGIGVQHGWQPSSEMMVVTEVEGARLISLDGFPAVEAFEEHARKTGQQLDRAEPLPFFLHNIVGIATANGHRLRVPLSIDEQGAVTCAAAIPAGSKITIMRTSSQSATEAASSAAHAAVRAMGGGKPSAALFFDCVATRLRLGDMFGFELQAVTDALGGSKFVGCNTYGQIARAAGQFGGFHNCTAVVLALPR